MLLSLDWNCSDLKLLEKDKATVNGQWRPNKRKINEQLFLLPFPSNYRVIVGPDQLNMFYICWETNEIL